MFELEEKIGIRIIKTTSHQANVNQHFMTLFRFISAEIRDAIFVGAALIIKI